MDRNYIYLDNNATTKVDEHVLEAMLPYFKEEYANPSSMYDFAKPASRAIKEARGVIKDFINAKDEKYQAKIKNLDTEHTALQTEYDSIKSALSKNIDRSFKTFS